MFYYNKTDWLAPAAGQEVSRQQDQEEELPRKRRRTVIPSSRHVTVLPSYHVKKEEHVQADLHDTSLNSSHLLESDAGDLSYTELDISMRGSTGTDHRKEEHLKNSAEEMQKISKELQGFTSERVPSYRPLAATITALACRVGTINSLS